MFTEIKKRKFARISINYELAAKQFCRWIVCALTENNNKTEVSSKNPTWVYGQTRHIIYNDRNVSRFFRILSFKFFRC